MYDFIFKAVQKGTRFYLASQSWCCHQKAQDPNTDHASSSQTYSANVLRFHWMKNSIIPVKKDLRHLVFKNSISPIYCFTIWKINSLIIDDN